MVKVWCQTGLAITLFLMLPLFGMLFLVRFMSVAKRGFEPRYGDMEVHQQQKQQL